MAAAESVAARIAAPPRLVIGGSADAHDEPPLYLPLFDPIFRAPKALGFLTPEDAEGQHSSEAVAQILLCQLVIRAAFKAWIVYALDQRMLLQPLRKGQRIVYCALDSQ